MTARRRTIALIITALVFSVTPALAQAASALTAVASDAGGVHVVVKPKNTAGPAWEFDVSMDTHIKPLNDDLTKAAVLVDGAGHRYAPTAWQGDPPGGHHRKGTLRFPAPTAPTKSFELHLQGVGGVGDRAFQWTAK